MLKKILHHLLSSKSSSHRHRTYSSSDTYHRKNTHYHSSHGHSHYGSTHYKKKHSSHSFFSS
ncbi:hypothetical protein EDM56_04420 [Brevibacillus fluminis]|uniref:Uncharacterized protein n=1 Tax=Brevibacillus fluminis TaxID=511487 RepID=A0A3M8DUZ6_9BACL|nr:hypothetical protein [Brevibacillus fluminis]RNB92003.1 hypothetical protein EDM56_04420 [Brevibacillus fluminis]